MDSKISNIPRIFLPKSKERIRIRVVIISLFFQDLFSFINKLRIFWNFKLNIMKILERHWIDLERRRQSKLHLNRVNYIIWLFSDNIVVSSSTSLPPPITSQRQSKALGLPLPPPPPPLFIFQWKDILSLV